MTASVISFPWLSFHTFFSVQTQTQMVEECWSHSFVKFEQVNVYLRKFDVASRVAERLKLGLRKLGKIKKISKLHRFII